MSKQPSEDTGFLGDDELPPPYAADQPTSVNSNGLAPAYSAATPLSSSSTIHPDSLFAAQLSSMRCQIRDQQATRATLQDQSDTRLLSLLIPHVEDMLASVAAMDPPPRLVQTTFVPDPAVARDWVPSEETHKGRSGETHELVRVQTTLPAKMAWDRKQATPTTATTAEAAASSEFDGWGRWGEDARGAGGTGGTSSSGSDKEQLWWSDEDMARRLARYLQPARKVVAVDRQTVAAKVAEAKRAKSRWSILGSGSKTKSGSGSEASTPTTPTPQLASVRVEDDVSMTVTAEEVTFRRENEMGIWESRTGWGVVVRVKIRS